MLFELTDNQVAEFQEVFNDYSDEVARLLSILLIYKLAQVIYKHNRLHDGLEE